RPYRPPPEARPKAARNPRRRASPAGDRIPGPIPGGRVRSARRRRSPPSARVAHGRGEPTEPARTPPRPRPGRCPELREGARCSPTELFAVAAKLVHDVNIYRGPPKRDRWRSSPRAQQERQQQCTQRQANDGPDPDTQRDIDVVDEF